MKIVGAFNLYPEVTSKCNS